jgi:hypothetical protein
MAKVLVPSSDCFDRLRSPKVMLDLVKTWINANNVAGDASCFLASQASSELVSLLHLFSLLPRGSFELTLM